MAGGSGLFGAEDHVEASERMGHAMEELKIREEHDAQQRRQAQLAQEKKRAVELDALVNQHIKDTIRSEHYEPSALQPPKHASEDDDDDEFLDELDQDPDFMRLREMRLKQLQDQYKIKQENLAKGHGEYREIVQDEFLKEVTSSPRVIVHFYHRDFERCKITDMHLAKIAKRHIECKVLKIDAEKAPFFVSKLVVRVLPTIILFEEGVANSNRIIGFEGLTDGVRAGAEDEFPTGNLARRLAKIGAIDSADDDDDPSPSRQLNDGVEDFKHSIECSYKL
ncbi:unnamed protein product [Aphanomyces euteiches]